VLERHGPVVAGDLIEAAERMGFPRVALQKARTRCGAVTINQGGQDKSKMWQVCLPEQVPDNKAPRMNPAAKTFGGEVERPEPEPDPYEGHVTELAAKVASNGKQPPTDQQAAFLLMAESLGMSLPDTTHATQVLDAVILSIESNLEALKAARAELA
jgi:hypothetical protein